MNYLYNQDYNQLNFINSRKAAKLAKKYFLFLFKSIYLKLLCALTSLRDRLLYDYLKKYSVIYKLSKDYQNIHIFTFSPQALLSPRLILSLSKKHHLQQHHGF